VKSTVGADAALAMVGAIAIAHRATHSRPIAV
jgi:hypothetical protein